MVLSIYTHVKPGNLVSMEFRNLLLFVIMGVPVIAIVFDKPCG